MKKKIILATLLLAALLPVHAQEKPQTWTLQSCIDYALEQNISIKQSQNTLEQNLVDTKSAKAALFPSLSFNTSHNYNNQPYGGLGSVGSSYNDGSINNYTGNYNLSANLTIYNGGRNLNNIRYNKLLSQTAEENIAEQKNQVILAVTQAYLQILYASEAVRINIFTLQSDSAQLERTRELMNNGLMTKVDVAQMESQLSTDAYQLVQSQTSLANYELQLKQLLEIEGSETMQLALPEISDEQVLTLLPDKEQVYATALGIMPEIKAGKLSTEAAELNEKIAKSGYYPTISLQASTGTGSNSASDLGFGKQLKQSWNNTIGISLSLPIFDNRSNKSAVEKARLQTLSSKLSESETAKTLYETIEQAWQNAYSSQNEYLAACEKEKYARQSYDLVSQQYAQGLKNTVELITEKTTYQNALQEKLQAKYMSLLNQKLLRFYQGEQPTL
ncbi:MAG: TolC family protein [Bacteroidaceae bacterium]|jgi:outer membrane protein